jgi:predicted Zn-dependent protease
MSNVVARLVGSLPAIRMLILLLAVSRPAFLAPQPRAQKPDQQTESDTDPQFLSALRAYKAQQYPTAQKQLEVLVQNDAGNFEINELLGLVYVAQGEQAKANPFLAKAVRLRPNTQ